MKVNSITVKAGRTFNHPHEEYSNLKPEVILTATLEDGEDASDAAKKLQAQAEGLVEDHKQSLLKSIEEVYEIGRVRSEVEGLESQLRRAQARLSEIRDAHPKLLELSGEAAAPLA